MKKSIAVATAAAAIQAAKSATRTTHKIYDRTSPDPVRMAEETARYQAEVQVIFSSRNKFSLDKSLFRRSMTAAYKWPELMLVEFLAIANTSDVGMKGLTTQDDLIVFCGYNKDIANAMRHRFMEEGLVGQTSVSYPGVPPGVCRQCYFLTGRGLHLALTMSSGKVARNVLIEIENEEAACLATPAPVRSNLCDTVRF